MRRHAISVVTAIVLATTVSAAAADGIKVSGDWTITIRNTDGTVAARHEFQNALAPATARDGGGALIARALRCYNGSICGAGFEPWGLGIWRVNIIVGGTTLMIQTSPTGLDGDEPGLSRNLSALYTPQGALLIRGSIRSTVTGPVSRVFTNHLFQDALRGNFVGDPFTQKDLQGVTVAEGQTIDVHIVIGFM